MLRDARHLSRGSANHVKHEIHSLLIGIAGQYPLLCSPTALYSVEWKMIWGAPDNFGIIRGSVAILAFQWRLFSITSDCHKDSSVEVLALGDLATDSCQWSLSISSLIPSGYGEDITLEREGIGSFSLRLMRVRRKFEIYKKNIKFSARSEIAKWHRIDPIVLYGENSRIGCIGFLHSVKDRSSIVCKNCFRKTARTK